MAPHHPFMRPGQNLIPRDEALICFDRKRAMTTPDERSQFPNPLSNPIPSGRPFHRAWYLALPELN